MKMILLKIVLVIIGLFAVVCIIAIFSPKNYTLSKEIVIHQPQQQVFAFIRLNANQPKYSRWLQFDPDTKIEYKGASDGNVGAILCFDSKNQKTGKGEWEITNVIEGEEVDFELRFLEPFVFTASGHMKTTAISDNQTKLEWVYNSGMNYPMNFMLLFLDMEKLVGTDLKASIENIKSSLEK
jgi:hypothetical protein